jgi:hypothetical protein
MTENKLFELAEKLNEQTRTGKITWETTASSNSFQTAFPQYTVRIARYSSDDEDRAPDYALIINDESGKTLESVTDVSLQAAVKPALPGGKAFLVMQELYNNARRGALGVDAAIESLLKSLGESDPF